MRIKGITLGGKNAYLLRVEHTITASTFAKALTDHFFRSGENFDAALTKKRGEDILKKSLARYGSEGEFDTTTFEGSSEWGAQWNEIFKESLDWVKSKYEWL